MTLVFVVGNSRSGTTMMSRIIGQHSLFFSFKELHFFGELWTPRENQEVFSRETAQKLMARLLCIQRDGYLTQGNPARFSTEAQEILQHIPVEDFTPASIFESFLLYESQQHNKLFPCDHTPRNVFYINEILALYPKAKIVNMVRDSPDVLLSQKRKWRRCFLGGDIPFQEAIRSKINYHPVTISKLWNAAITAGEKFDHHERVYSLNFEELLKNPEVKVREICSFLDIPFEAKLLDVPQIGSSSALDDPEKRGIDSSKAGNWRKGGLSPTEIFLCQQITQKHRERYNYEPITVKPNYLELIHSLISLPIQLTLALFLNLSRMRCIADNLRRRWAGNLF